MKYLVILYRDGTWQFIAEADLPEYSREMLLHAMIGSVFSGWGVCNPGNGRQHAWESIEPYDPRSEMK